MYANGYGDHEGSHLSMFVCLMKGENDQNLQWPFKGDITIRLLNWKEDKQHVEKIIHFNESIDIEYRSRVIEGERALGLGHHLISHGNLHLDQENNRAYLRNDTLCIEIHKVTLPTGNIIVLHYTQCSIYCFITCYIQIETLQLCRK